MGLTWFRQAYCSGWDDPASGAVYQADEITANDSQFRMAA